MRACESAAIAAGTVTGYGLMGRAGRGVVDAILSDADLAMAARAGVLVLAGPGNNGGDGYVIAALMKAKGFAVRILALGDPARLPPDAARAHDLWCRDGGAVEDGEALGDEWGADPALARCGLIVDALFGAGLSRPIEGTAAVLMARANALCDAGARLVAVDCPSGLDMDNGALRALGAAGEGFAIRADLTVTFHAERPGHFLDAGPEQCGRLACVEIGLDDKVSRISKASALDAAALMPPRSGHKYQRGHVLVAAGPRGRTGAARLSARAALRTGAGLATFLAPEESVAELAASERAVMIRAGDGAAGLQELLADPRYGALVLGPGNGIGDRLAGMVEAALADPRPRGIVLDADALTSFAGEPGRLFAAIRSSASKVVLTPHEGEFARLFGDLVGMGKLDAACKAAARSGAVMLLKGADTVAAHPDGRAIFVPAAYGREAPFLATAGSGDILAGIVAALLLRGGDALDAAAAGAFLHQEAGRRAGPGSMAEDIESALRGVLAQV
ncbi:MAG: NAD(P)H-hydrate dehydratase [Hyphomicrobiaceae bacterium]|nr:NAD(P)H-hydrate dehydratase [Hyphomicrobiaceae bacterium]